MSNLQTQPAQPQPKPGSARFYYLLFGLLFSRLGNNIYLLALPWLAYDLTGSSVQMGTVFAFETLPFILLLPLGGVIIDRSDRRMIMMVCDIARMALIISLPLLYWADLLTMAYIFVLSFVISSLSFFVDISMSAIIPNLVNKEQLIKSNGQLQLVDNTVRLLGPILAGTLLAAIGTPLSIFICGFSYLVMAFCVLLIGKIPRPDASGQEPKTIWQDMREGFAYGWNRIDLRAIGAISMLANFGLGLVMSTLIFYLRDTLGTNEWRVGFVFSSVGIFGIIGALITPQLTKRFRRGFLLSFMMIFGGGLGGGLIALVPYWIATGLGLGILLGSVVVMNVILNAYKQGNIDNQMFGRVEGAITSISNCCIPLAGVVGGITIGLSSGSVITYLLATAMIVGSGLISFFTPLRKIA
ncbi:Na+/melibiose symporter-like transporter [Tumebacillus sp. BK434]|uniref:MFS transporter n=1 Tax=Tumebacillus sp. BK434 TaxID=2512169 RepID=UPI00104AAF9C|nr:MFS transporter [Tumebacillus sp. BK434]TCP53858.1 Na+/melibiose symporter-like transporter [Tumebacillus sp. BK434]